MASRGSVGSDFEPVFFMRGLYREGFFDGRVVLGRELAVTCGIETTVCIE